MGETASECVDVLEVRSAEGGAEIGDPTGVFNDPVLWRAFSACRFLIFA
jgi:hypothetical protein